jgi:exonuclease VII small subunit
MKVLTLLALTASAAASAQSIYERQVQTIVQVLNSINTDTLALNTAVRNFNGPQDLQTLQQASNRVAQTVSSGAQAVSQASSISLNDAVQLQGQVQQLQSTIEGTVQNLVAKKQILVQSGAGPIVAQGLNSQLQSAQQLSTAIVSKVPQGAQPLAQQLSNGINNALQQGVQQFSDQQLGGNGQVLPSNGVFASNGGFGSPTQPGFGTFPTQTNPSFFTGAAVPRAVAGGLVGLAAGGVAAMVL